MAAFQYNDRQAIFCLHGEEGPQSLRSSWDSLRFMQDGSVTPVMVDPYLCRHLRPHQREGVAFLYACVMGLREQRQRGAILADDMGLGYACVCVCMRAAVLLDAYMSPSQYGPPRPPGAPLDCVHA